MRFVNDNLRTYFDYFRFRLLCREIPFGNAVAVVLLATRENLGSLSWRRAA
jgi:hypothetical protein